MGAGSSHGAASSVVVSLTVPSATFMSVDPDCVGTSSILNLGTVLPDTISASADCTVTFGSSNDSSTLRMFQADETGVAMWQTVGAPDLAYGGGDAVSDLVDIGGGNDVGYSAHRLGDGRLLVAGQGGAADDFVVVRFDANGMRDLTYGGGDAISDIVNVGGTENPFASVLLPDGKLIVTGKGGPGDDFVAVRFDPNGSRDLSYGGGDGVSDLVDIGGIDRAFASLLLPDGKLVLAGQGALTDDFVVVRYNADGSVDTTYGGGDGISDVVDVGGTEAGYAARLLSSGKLIVVGRSDNRMVAVRYNANGSLDTTYGGGDGISVLVPVGSSGRAYTVHVLAGDKILLAGQGNDDLVAVRLNANGSIDTTYGGGDGISDYIDMGGVESGRSSLLLPDGRLAISGQTGAGGDIGIALLNADGSRDTTYGGGDGTSTLVNAGGATDTAYTLLLGADGKIIAAGSGGASRDFLAVQFDSNGIAQYDDGSADWDTAGSFNAFGACLKSVGGGASNQWPTNATCTTTDGTWWNDVPATADEVAFAAVPGESFVATVRFAVRTREDQPPGRYVAPIVFEVVAPDS